MIDKLIIVATFICVTCMQLDRLDRLFIFFDFFPIVKMVMYNTSIEIKFKDILASLILMY